MARNLRIDYPQAIHHIRNQGNRREAIFTDEADREQFLRLLGQVCQKANWQVHAYCLMPDHFHLVVETLEAGLVDGMKWFLGTYTARFNRRHGLSGHLFGGRYRSFLVDGGGGGYVREVCEYVHLNPVRAGLLGPEHPLAHYPWSSYVIILREPEDRPPWLCMDRIAAEEGLDLDSAAGRREFSARMENRRQGEESRRWESLRHAWAHGRAEFKDQIVRRINSKRGLKHYGIAPPETREARAERVVLQELKARRWNDSDLLARRKTDGAKIQIAQRLRRETPMPLRWIAARLRMGSVYTLRNALLANQQDRPKTRSLSKLECGKAGGANSPVGLPTEAAGEEFDVVWD